MNNYVFEDLYIGLSADFEAVITDEMLESFIKLSGDVNPLHTDEGYAKLNGMNGRVIHGMLTSSLYSTLVGVYLPGEKCLLHGIDIVFKKPVYINEKVKIYGEVVYLNEVFKIAEIKAYIKNVKNQKISIAKIKVGVI